MTPQQIEAVKLAKEALEDRSSLMKWQKARDAINEALAEHAMQEVQRLGQEIEQKIGCVNHDCDQCKAQPEQEPVAVYGYCPQCGAKGVMRERRPNGNDKCANGHTYPSRTATTPPQRKPLTDGEKRELIKKSALWDMHTHIGWYSAPAKSFVEKATQLIADIEAAHGIKENT